MTKYDDELTGPLLQAIEQIRADPAPEHVLGRVLQRAAALAEPAAGRGPVSVEIGQVRKSFRCATWVRCAVAAAVMLMAIAALTFWWRRDPAPAPQQFAQQTPDVEQKQPSEVPPKPEPSKNAEAKAPAGAFGLDGIDKARGVTAFGGAAGASPTRHFAVAPEATVLVSTGGKKPLRLGEVGKYDKDMFLHVWDWSKSDESKPLEAVHAGGMAVSPDGKWIVCRDGRRIDAATGAVRQLDGFGGDVAGLRFAPDGRTLLLQVQTGNDQALARLLDFPEGKKRCEIPGLWSYTFAAAFTPDGKQVLFMDKDRILHRWDAHDGKELQNYEPAFTNSIRAVTVSADGKHVAGAGTRGEIYLWDVDQPKMRHQLVSDKQPDGTILNGLDSLAFTPDGRHIAGGGIFRVILWETTTGDVARYFPPGSSAHIRFSKDGTRMTTVRDIVGVGRNGGGLAYPQVKRWEVETGREIVLRD